MERDLVLEIKILRALKTHGPMDKDGLYKALREESSGQWNRIDSHIELLEDEGLIKIVIQQGDTDKIRLTGAGHDFLDNHQAVRTS